jgi:hypothetical protein
MTQKNNDGQSLKWLLIMVFVMGILTELLIVIPAKLYKWSKINKNIRGPLFTCISPMGNGFISLIGISNYIIYGMFWIFVAIIITNYIQPHFHFCNFYTEESISILTHEVSRKFNGDTAFIWSMIFCGSLVFLAWSAYAIYRDINETNYEDCDSEEEKEEITSIYKENEQIRKIENNTQLAKDEKRLNEIKIEKLPF